MMNFDLTTLFLLGCGYLLILFGLAHATEKNWIPTKVVTHPLTYVLSLGICITTWCFYSVSSAAAVRGYGYMAYYIGISAAFLFAPIFLQPILHITRTYQLSSLADLFAFRFRSPWAGILTTFLLLICIFPLLALQIWTVSTSAEILAPGINANFLALIFSLIMVAFTILLGTREHSSRDKHEGLVVAMAFDTLVKSLILIGLGFFAVYQVFDGPGALDQWLMRRPDYRALMDIPFFENSTNLIILLFFVSAIGMPQMFHMVFRENIDPKTMKTASWALPLLLLLISIPTLPILWAYYYLGSELQVDYAILALGQWAGSNFMVLVTFLGGFAAACAMLLVISLSMSSMCVNHLILPLHTPSSKDNLYQWLRRWRRFLIAAIILAAFTFNLFIGEEGLGLTDTGYISFIALVQFLPGILTLLYWPRGNAKGFLCGLVAGFSVWFILGLLPLFSDLVVYEITYPKNASVNWNLVASLSLVANMLTLVLVSLFSHTSDEERSAADMCAMDNIRGPKKQGLVAKTPQEFIQLLSEPLGTATARREVLQALKDLGIPENEKSPYSIHLLRSQLEANLSGLLGPTIAFQIIDNYLPYEMISDNANFDLGFLENRLETYPGNLSGVAAALDDLRRYHKQILRDLPMGICSLDKNNKISLWNSAMEELTGISKDLVVGFSLNALSEPWRSLLKEFSEAEQKHLFKKSLDIMGKQHWFNLHKASIERSSQQNNTHDEDLVIMLEDLTETERLEAELTHSERLASIGRLAAGVAHEIGNPITGIACLAQNLRDETHDRELRQMAEQIIEQTRRTSRIVESLVNFAHSGRHREEGVRTRLCVRRCVDEAIALISLNQKSKGIHFSNQCRTDSEIFSDEQRLLQVFVNLLTNARDASQAGFVITVTDSIMGGNLNIIITDEGDGIPEAIKEHIFEPFFTTKDPGQGTGLGLSVVYSIVENLGGHIDIESPVDAMSRKGTRVILSFPCYYDELLQKVAKADA